MAVQLKGPLNLNSRQLVGRSRCGAQQNSARGTYQSKKGFKKLK
jgi:hypothetical protein